MVEFFYNNAKKASTSHIPFKLNCGFYSQVLFKKNTSSYLRSCSANKLVKELKELIEICYQNRLYI